MDEERLIILRLLEEGKITESEAEQLLEALGDMEYDEATKETHHTFSNFSKEKNKDKKTEGGKSFEEAIDILGKKFENLGEQLGDRMEVFSEQFGKKIGNLGVLLADKSVNLADKMVDIVEKAIDSDILINNNFFGNTNSYEEILEKEIREDSPPISLELRGQNGSITVESWSENKIKVLAIIQTKEERYEASKPILEMKEEENKLIFLPKETEGIAMKLKIMVPHQAYHYIKCQTKNGPISISDINCSKLFINTKNGSIDLKKANAKEEISCTTLNGKINLRNCQSHHLLAATKNGKISIENSMVGEVEALTTNSRIIIDSIDYYKLNSMTLKTSNGKIEICSPLPEGIAAKIEASTTNSKININTPVEYKENIQNYSSTKVIAYAGSFEDALHKLSIKAYTTNGSIFIF